MLSNNKMTKEFVPNHKGYQVLTPSGYQEFAGVAHMGDKPIFKLKFGNTKYLECTELHRLFTPDGKSITVKDLDVGSTVLCKDGEVIVITEKIDTGRVEAVYDLIDVKGGHKYYTNGVLSHNCEFVSDDETLINSLTLSVMRSIDPEFYTGKVRWFKEPEANKAYLIALDPCLGTGGDFAAIQVFQYPEMVQVAEWMHNQTPARGQVQILLQILMILYQTLREDPAQDGDPQLFWTVENNTIGETILQIIDDTGEQNFPGIFVSEQRKAGASRRFRKGLNTDNRKKLAACGKMKSLVESRRMVINSKELIKQLKFFVSSGAGYAAKLGEKDDLVSATLLVVRMIETAMQWAIGIDHEDLKDAIDPEDAMHEPMPVVIN